MAGLCLLAACSGGGSGSAAKTTTTVSSTTTTTVAVTTTTTPEDAVKQAYLDYWKMSDRLSAVPDPNDPELAQRAAEPLLSFVRDNLSTEKAEGRTFTVPAGKPNDHRIQSVQISGSAATLTECFIDGRAELDHDGNVIDDSVFSKLGSATLVQSGGVWLLTAVNFTQRTPGDGGCAAS